MGRGAGDASARSAGRARGVTTTERGVSAPERVAARRPREAPARRPGARGCRALAVGRVVEGGAREGDAARGAPARPARGVRRGAATPAIGADIIGAAWDASGREDDCGRGRQLARARRDKFSRAARARGRTTMTRAALRP